MAAVLENGRNQWQVSWRIPNDKKTSSQTQNALQKPFKRDSNCSNSFVSDCCDKLFELFNAFANENHKRKPVVWPLQMMLLVLCPVITATFVLCSVNIFEIAKFQ